MEFTSTTPTRARSATWRSKTIRPESAKLRTRLSSMSLRFPKDTVEYSPVPGLEARKGRNPEYHKLLKTLSNPYSHNHFVTCKSNACAATQPINGKLTFEIRHDPFQAMAYLDILGCDNVDTMGVASFNKTELYVKAYLFSENNVDRRSKSKTVSTKQPLDSPTFFETLSFPLFTTVEESVFKIEVWGRRRGGRKQFFGHTHARFLQGVTAGVIKTLLRPYDNLRGCFDEPLRLSSRHNGAKVYEDGNVRMMEYYVPPALASLVGHHNQLRKYLGLRLIRSANGIEVTSVDNRSLSATAGLKAGQTILSINGGDTRIITCEEMLDLFAAASGVVTLGVELGPQYEDLPYFEGEANNKNNNSNSNTSNNTNSNNTSNNDDEFSGFGEYTDEPNYQRTYNSNSNNDYISISDKNNNNNSYMSISEDQFPFDDPLYEPVENYDYDNKTTTNSTNNNSNNNSNSNSKINTPLYDMANTTFTPNCTLTNRRVFIPTPETSDDESDL